MLVSTQVVSENNNNITRNEKYVKTSNDIIAGNGCHSEKETFKEIVTKI